MNREEAIKIMHSIRKFYSYITPNEELTAINMAIEALKAQKLTHEKHMQTHACENTMHDSDVISRQAALAEFEDGRDVFDIMESIEQLPSVQVTSKLKKPYFSLLKRF